MGAFALHIDQPALLIGCGTGVLLGVAGGHPSRHSCFEITDCRWTKSVLKIDLFLFLWRKDMLRIGFILLLAGLLMLEVGCAKPASSDDGAKKTKVSFDTNEYILKTEPGDAKGVVEIRESCKDDEEIRIVGKIGGSKTPWIDGMIAFTIVDPSCEECLESETPWEYCCIADIASKTIFVKFVDDAGRTLRGDAKSVFGLTELQTVVITGKAKRDRDGAVSVLASKIFPRK